eukprot:6546296-Pyramimonas_sp.AAC.1
MGGRSFAMNIAEVDAVARAYSCRPEADEECPILSALDYGRAFPSLSQQYLYLVLQRMGCPAALLMFVRILCTAIEGAMPCCGTMVSAFWIRSGIIQGGALSGSLFAFALTPTLHDLYVSLEKGRMGISRACADDNGG